MATRRKYKRGGSVSITLDEPGALPPTNVTDANAQVPETLPTPPPVNPVRKAAGGPELPPPDPSGLDAVRRAAEAARLADEYQRHPQRFIDQHVDSMPNLSEHKRAFLKANPMLLSEGIMPLAGAAWQQALASGVANDSPEMNRHILQAVSQGMARRQMPPQTPAMAPPPMPMPMPGDEAERLQADAYTYLAAMKGVMPEPVPANLPPIERPRRSLPVSAPVSRDVPTASGAKTSQQTTITLTPEQREVAWGAYHWLSKPRAEEEYARQRLKLDSLRKAGMYPGPERN